MTSLHLPSLCCKASRFLSGAKHTKPTLQQNFAKEPACPSHSATRTERQCSKNERQNIEGQEWPACNRRYILLPK